MINKSYELRTLCAKDIFLMSKIISKIGIKEFSKSFQSEDTKHLIQTLQGDTEQDATTIVGVSVVLEIATVILENLPNCEQELYGLLASLSGMAKEDISKLPMDVFLKMIVDVIRKEEFTNFIRAVSGLLKSES